MGRVSKCRIRQSAPKSFIQESFLWKNGLTPKQIIVSATGDAASSLGLDELGTLEPGKWADFIVLTDNPLEDIKNTRSIESVWIAGNRVPERK